ncbi:ankyrin repeat-containing domain protein [Baffinella frigidus]|nr:ankyrin repeat-containing domain protein [Cryptophyta sp. CCMP2293]
MLERHLSRKITDNNNTASHGRRSGPTTHKTDEQLTLPVVATLRRPYIYSKANANSTTPIAVPTAQPKCTARAVRDAPQYHVNKSIAPRRLSQLDVTRYTWGTPQIDGSPSVERTPSCTEISQQETNSKSISTHTAFDTYSCTKIHANRPGHTWGVATPTRRRQDTYSAMEHGTTGDYPMSLVEAVHNGTAVDMCRILTRDVRTINDPVDLDGNTAMHIAAAKGDSDKVRTLMQFKAKRLIKNCHGNTAIVEAVYNGQLTIVFQLDMWPTDSSYAPIHDPIHETKKGETLLMAVVKQLDNNVMVSVLLALQVDTCAVDETHGQTALMMAVSAGNEDAVCLLSYTNQSLHIQDKLGNTALHMAMMPPMRNSQKMMKDLLRHTCQDTINMTNNKALTVLHLAVRHCSPETVQHLTRLGPNIHIVNTIKINANQDHVVQSPIFDAVCNRPVHMVITLLQQGTSDNYPTLEARDVRGRTLLIAAIQHQNVAVASWLMEVGASAVPHCDTGYTALHWAAHWGYPNLCAQIISLGGFNRTKNKWGLTPYDYADNSEDDEYDREHEGQDELPDSVYYRNYYACMDLLRHTAESTSERIQAFAQCRQDRLGTDAGARVLPTEILQMIHTIAHGKDA